MTVCAHRLEETGFFTPCSPCTCGREVLAELAAQAIPTENDPEEQP